MAALAPLCTTELAEGLSRADPANVPATRRTGPPAAYLFPGGAEGRITIPTDAGRPIVVAVVRQGTRWLASDVIGV